MAEWTRRSLLQSMSDAERGSASWRNTRPGVALPKVTLPPGHAPAIFQNAIAPACARIRRAMDTDDASICRCEEDHTAAFRAGSTPLAIWTRPLRVLLNGRM